MDITKAFLDWQRPNHSRRKMVPQYITVHDTGNPAPGADASAHAAYLATTTTLVSWHYTVDDRQVVQHLADDVVGYHTGHRVGNDTSIGIEICMNEDGDRTAAEVRAAALIAYLCQRHGLPLSAVLPHQHWNGKRCPQLLLPRWRAFLDQVAQVPLLAQMTWQEAALAELIDRGVIATPAYWQGRLGEPASIGEVIGLIAKIPIPPKEA